MIELSLQRAAQWLSVPAPSGELTFRGVTTDSRAVEPGALFVALKGPNFDGHDFVEAAAANGAVAAVVEHPVDAGLPQLQVDSTLKALGELAAGWRRLLGLTVVGITGSNGKTTVKEMVAAILSRRGRVLATAGNLNNEIGVPLTLLRLSREDRFAVVEMGANAPGEIARLTRIAGPDVALVNNTGHAHLEGFGGPEGVVRAKGEIFEGLSAKGVAVLNADDASIEPFRALNRDRQTLEFSLEEPADVRGRWQVEPGINRLTLEGERGGFDIELPLPGRHNAANALAAAAIARALGVEDADIRAGLEGMEPVLGRLQDRPGPAGSHLLDDTYNANPDSLEAGLAVLQARPEEAWLVLGDMGELGAGSEALHARAGDLAREYGVRRLFTLGDLATRAGEHFGSDARHFDDRETLIETLRRELGAGVCVLVKGSRSMHMERVVRALTGESDHVV